MPFKTMEIRINSRTEGTSKDSNGRLSGLGWILVFKFIFLLSSVSKIFGRDPQIINPVIIPFMSTELTQSNKEKSQYLISTINLLNDG